MRIELTPQDGPEGLVTMAPWDLNRMLDKAQLKPSPSPQATLASFDIEGREAVLEITADSVGRPFRVPELPGCSYPGWLAAHPGRPGSDRMHIPNTGQPAPAQAIAGKGLLDWAQLPSVFNPVRTRHWWADQADGAALRTYLHGGALNATLFATLFSFAGESGARND